MFLAFSLPACRQARLLFLLYLLRFSCLLECLLPLHSFFSKCSQGLSGKIFFVVCLLPTLCLPFYFSPFIFLLLSFIFPHPIFSSSHFHPFFFSVICLLLTAYRCFTLSPLLPTNADRTFGRCQVVLP